MWEWKMTKQAKEELTMFFNYGEKRKNKLSGLQMIENLQKVTKQNATLKQTWFVSVVLQTLPQRRWFGYLTRLSVMLENDNLKYFHVSVCQNWLPIHLHASNEIQAIVTGSSGPI